MNDHYTDTKEILKKIRKSDKFGSIPIKYLIKALNTIDLSQGKSFKEIMELLLPALRAQGAINTHKLDARETNEGLIGMYHGQNATGLVGISCSSDFVARSQSIKNFISQIAEIVALQRINSSEELLKATYQIDNHQCTVAEHIEYLCVELGEKIAITIVYFMEHTAGHSIGSYVHGKLDNGDNNTNIELGTRAGLVKIDQPDHATLAHDLALHIVGNNIMPIVVSPENVPQEIMDQERKNIESQVEANIPADKLQMINANRLQKRLSELSLLTQICIKSDSKETVKQYIGTNKVLEMKGASIK